MKTPIAVLTAAVLCATYGHAYAQASVMVELKQGRKAVKSHAPVPETLVWLEPADGNRLSRAVPWPSNSPFRLLQKNKMFTPHLLVVPVGTAVAFPNADPFFHNVFSLFDGSRFDLGLYEAGSTRDVRFSRKGISYIFCNIHPEMAAIVVALDTPLWVRGTGPGVLTLNDVPEGRYQVHIWVEGQDPHSLEHWLHTISVVGQGSVDAGSFAESEVKPSSHLNEFGQPYPPTTSPY